MREIKFRAWDKTGKRMVSWHDKMFAGETVFNNGILLCEYPLRYASDETNLFTYMQYTDLKDTRGKEIFEGDILKFKLPNEPYWKSEENQTPIGKVEYEPDKGGYILIFREHGYKQPYERLTCDTAFESEIIGNIYENPELKEAK
jgi:uncharacterized phage protein (TIGR01671 family)